MSNEFYKKNFKEENKVVAYFRIPAELKDFIDRLPEIHAIDVDGWNMGFAVDLQEMRDKNTEHDKNKERVITYLVPGGVEDESD